MKITRQQVMDGFIRMSGGSAGINFANEVNRYAASRNVKKFKRHVEDIEEYSQELRLKYCFKDKDDCPEKDGKGNFKFKTDKEKEFSKEMKAYMKEEVDFEPYLFRKNSEIEAMKFLFINADIEFLLDETLLKDPNEEHATEEKSKWS